MHTNPDYALTIVAHDLEQRVVVNKTRFSHNIKYTGANLNQVSKLVEISAACGQELSHDCQNAPIYPTSGAIKMNAWWLDRRGKQVKSWGNSRHDYRCDCGNDKSCSGGKKFGCNCDVADSVLRRDEGIVKDRRQLPINTVIVNGRSGDDQYRAIKVGQLVCSG